MRIKIQTPTLPPNIPPVILASQTRVNAQAGFVTDILRKVAKKHQNLLIQNALLKGKFQNLTVYVSLFSDDEDPDRPEIPCNHTSGEYCMKFEERKPAGTVQLFVNIEDSPKYIAYVFAHELAHMLADVQMDLARICDQSQSGCTPGSSCINRIMPAETDMFGEGLEESIADVLAMYVVSRCRFSDEAGTYAQLASQWHHRQTFAHLLASAFGDPLMECNYIDEFTEIVLPELYQEARVTEEGIEEEAKEFARIEIKNLFWYCVAVNQFHLIVDAYNDTMGEGSWRELCRHMDAVQYDIYYKGIVGEPALEHQRQAEKLLKDFVLKYTANQENVNDNQNPG